MTQNEPSQAGQRGGTGRCSVKRKHTRIRSDRYISTVWGSESRGCRRLFAGLLFRPRLLVFWGCVERHLHSKQLFVNRLLVCSGAGGGGWCSGAGGSLHRTSTGGGNHRMKNLLSVQVGGITAPLSPHGRRVTHKRKRSLHQTQPRPAPSLWAGSPENSPQEAKPWGPPGLQVPWEWRAGPLGLSQAPGWLGCPPLSGRPLAPSAVSL